MKVESTLADIKVQDQDSKKVVISIAGRRIEISESADGFYIHMIENNYRPNMMVLPVNCDTIEII